MERQKPSFFASFSEMEIIYPSNNYHDVEKSHILRQYTCFNGCFYLVMLVLRGVVVSFWEVGLHQTSPSQVGSLHFMSLDDFSKRLSDGTAVVPANLLEKVWQLL